MSLYLQAAIGAARYLIPAEAVVEVRSAADREMPAHWRGEPVPRLDLRALFGAEPLRSGVCLFCAQACGRPAALFVDAVHGLLDIADRELRPLPPIGRFGQLIDAVSTVLAQGPAQGPAQGRPMLRLRAERALAAADADRA